MFKKGDVVYVVSHQIQDCFNTEQATFIKYIYEDKEEFESGHCEKAIVLIDNKEVEKKVAYIFGNLDQAISYFEGLIHKLINSYSEACREIIEMSSH